jgi:transcriptional regulator with XRE-family HTH domain
LRWPRAASSAGPAASHNQAAESSAAELQAQRLQDFLKARREHLGLRQVQVAERLEISERAYGNWERGQVREWADEKLYALAEALEMSEYQTTRLFLYAAGRAPRPDLHATFRRTEPQNSEIAAFLNDYAIMMDALAFPTFVIDRCWDIKMANRAYRELFTHVRPHPTAMPTRNFLRFGLFHPDAPSILVHHGEWQLAMLAQLSSNIERHSGENGLLAMRRDVYRHPHLRDAYLNDMPKWVMGCGSDLSHHEGTIRQLRHPDPHVGLQGCRLVEETPRSLQRLGLTRLTAVLVDLKEHVGSASRGSHDHHAA